MHATPGFEPGWGDELTRRTFPLFFDILRLLLEQGVTVVAEAAFQHKLWAPHLEPLVPLANVRVVQCLTDADTARRRVEGRGVRTAHADVQWLDGFSSEGFAAFDRVHVDAPSIDVDTTDGYAPSLDDVVAFVNSS